MDSNFTTQLNTRTAAIFAGIQTGQVGPENDALNELAQLLITAEDQPAKAVVVARLTVTRANGWKTIVEVEAGSTFHSFFKYYKQFGNKRSTKEHIRTASRNDGGRIQPRLEHVASKLAVYQSMSNPIVRSTIRIFNKAKYHALLNVSPDRLGLTKTHVRFPLSRFTDARPS